MKRRQRTMSVLGTSVLLVLASCGGGDGASAEKFCDLSEQAKESGDKVDAAFESGSASKIERAVTNAIEDDEAALKVAPKDIKATAETMLEAEKDLAKILESNDWDFEAAAEDPDFQDLINDSDIQDASDELDSYLDDECGIAPDDDVAGGSDTTNDGGGDEPVTTDEVIVVPDDTTPLDTVPVDTEATSATLELTAEVGGTTVGETDSPQAVYAAILTNPSSNPVSNLQIDFTIFGDGDLVVGTGSAYVDLILPGATRAVSGTTTLTSPAVRIEANYNGDVGMPYGLEDADLPAGEFTFEGVSLKSDDYSTGVIGLMKSTYPIAFDNVEVTVIFRDAAGAVIGGGYDYATIQANGQVGVEPSAYYQIPNVATFELYGSYATYDLGD